MVSFPAHRRLLSALDAVAVGDVATHEDVACLARRLERLRGTAGDLAAASPYLGFLLRQERKSHVDLRRATAGA